MQYWLTQVYLKTAVRTEAAVSAEIFFSHELRTHFPL